MNRIPLLLLFFVFEFANAASISKGLTAAGLAKILASESIAKDLKNHGIDGVEIDTVDNVAGSSGFLIVLHTSIGATSKSEVEVRVPCFIGITAVKPDDQPSAEFTLTTKKDVRFTNAETDPLQRKTR